MDAESKDLLAQRERFRKRHRMPRRAAATLTHEQAERLLSLKPGELLPLELNGKIVVFVRDDSLPTPPLWCAPRWTEFSAPEVRVPPAILVTVILATLIVMAAMLIL